MTVNPYESPPGKLAGDVQPSSERLYALAYAGLAVVLFVLVGFPGAFSLVWLSMVDPSLEGADLTREITRKMISNVPSHFMLLGYLTLLYSVFCAFFVFLFAAATGALKIRTASRVAMIAGFCLALWSYGYVVVCSYGWIDSWFFAS